MKKIIFSLIFLLISSCSVGVKDDDLTQKSSAASSRIDNVQSGSNTILKDLND